MVAMAKEVKLYDICDDPAKFFCPANSAFLCGDCDEQIHGANLLARKHQRLIVDLMGDSHSSYGEMNSPNSTPNIDSVTKGVMPKSIRNFSMAMSAPPALGDSWEGNWERRSQWRAKNIPLSWNDQTHGESEEWPQLGSVPIVVPKSRRIIPATGVLEQSQLIYKPTTTGGK
jgi:hypothetical protein